MGWEHIEAFCERSGDGFEWRGVYPAFRMPLMNDYVIVRLDESSREIKTFIGFADENYRIGNPDVTYDPVFHLLFEKDMLKHYKFMRQLERDKKISDFIENPEASKWYIPMISIISAITAIIATLIMRS